MYRIAKVVVVLAVFILMSGAAQAASNNSETAINWSGPYVGGFAGYSWNHLKYSEPDWPGSEREPNIQGFTGGALLGYNRRTDRIVWGVEADGGLGKFSEDADMSTWNNYSSFKIDWNAHLRARAGFLSGATLLYAAGGLALAKVSVDDIDPGWGEDHALHAGWTIGAGIEHAITKNLRVRVEYLYDDYGSKDYEISGAFVYKANIKLTTDTVRFGLSYSF